VNFKDHVCALNEPSGSVIIEDIMATPVDVPLSTLEDKLATSLVRRKLAQGSDGCLRFKTGGQVVLYLI
jgi:predicted membrane protein